ncbi:reverse transcriptase [Trichonephila clavipes]|nr:reverse transcriptase [Trichonephila clavipes]
MDDNASLPQANIVNDCLQYEFITPIEWREFSSDLIPAHHIWYMLDQRLSALQTRPTCVPELRKALLVLKCGKWKETLPHVLKHYPSYTAVWKTYHNAILARVKTAVAFKSTILNENQVVVPDGLRLKLVAELDNAINIIDVIILSENRWHAFEQARDRNVEMHPTPLSLLTYKTKSFGEPWETLATVGPIPRHQKRAEAVARFRPTTGHDFLGVYFHWFGLAANEACPLCGHARMEGDHLLQCTGPNEHPTDDIVSRCWEARRQMVKKRNTGVG